MTKWRLEGALSKLLGKLLDNTNHKSTRNWTVDSWLPKLPTVLLSPRQCQEVSNVITIVVTISHFFFLSITVTLSYTPPPPYPPLYSQFGCEPISPILPLLLLLLPRIDQTELPQGLNWVKDVTKWQFPELKAWFLQNRLSDCQNVNQKLYFANRNSLTFTGLEV